MEKLYIGWVDVDEEHPDFDVTWVYFVYKQGERYMLDGQVRTPDGTLSSMISDQMLDTRFNITDTISVVYSLSEQFCEDFCQSMFNTATSSCSENLLATDSDSFNDGLDDVTRSRISSLSAIYKSLAQHQTHNESFDTYCIMLWNQSRCQCRSNDRPQLLCQDFKAFTADNKIQHALEEECEYLHISEEHKQRLLNFIIMYHQWLYSRSTAYTGLVDIIAKVSELYNIQRRNNYE